MEVQKVIYNHQAKMLSVNGVAVPVLDETSDALPLLCVDMITYNQEAYIEKAIESVLIQQTTFKFVLVIGEDCSTDATREIVKRYQKNHPDKIILKLPENNLGMLYNETSNVALCNSKYLAWLEGDDYWTDPLKLQKQVDFLEANPDYVLCFHNVSVLQPDGNLVADYITQLPQDYETVETLARSGNYIHTPSAVFRNAIREFPFEYYTCCVPDFFTYIILGQFGKFKRLEENMAVYRAGIGIFSGEIRTKRSRYNVNLYSSLLSYLQDENLKKLVYVHYEDALLKLENSIRKDFTTQFVSSHPFFLALKFVKTNIRQPRKIADKIKMKFFKR